MLRSGLAAFAMSLVATTAFGDPSNFGWNDHRMGAAYEDPTTRYAHGVLGDAIEYGTLVVELKTNNFR